LYKNQKKYTAMTQISPYITFEGQCRDAMTFYQECLGGELELMVIEESPMADQFPPAMQKSILHSSLTKDAMIILGSDMAGREGVIKGNNVTLSLTSSSEEEMNNLFSVLSAGGKVLYPIEDFFAGRMGTLQDKFGMYWTVYFDNTGSR
jgi:PhnB protein